MPGLRGAADRLKGSVGAEVLAQPRPQRRLEVSVVEVLYDQHHMGAVAQGQLLYAHVDRLPQVKG